METGVLHLPQLNIELAKTLYKCDLTGPFVV